MQVIYGEKGCKYTWQDNFPETIKCDSCKEESRIAFVYYETPDEVFYLCDMRKEDDQLWLHDACSVAIYFCPHCLNAQVRWNQG